MVLNVNIVIGYYMGVNNKVVLSAYMCKFSSLMALKRNKKK